MKKFTVRYRDEMSRGEWRTQHCICHSVDECKRIYGLGTDPSVQEYEIISASYQAVINEVVETTFGERETHSYLTTVAVGDNYHDVVNKGIEFLEKEFKEDAEQEDISEKDQIFWKDVEVVDVDEVDGLFTKNSLGLYNPLEIAGIEGCGDRHDLSYTLFVLRIEHKEE